LGSADAASLSKDEGKVTTERFRNDFLLAVDKDGRVDLAESSSDRSRTVDLRLFDAVGVRAAALFKTIRVGILYTEMMTRRTQLLELGSRFQGSMQLNLNAIINTPYKLNTNPLSQYR
jgi:hypothetical protein